MQFQSDIEEDLRDAFGYQEKGSSWASHRVLGDGHCSALIKILPNNEDLYTTHDTWSDYHTMLRVFKLYNLPYKSLGTGTTSKLTFMLILYFLVIYCTCTMYTCALVFFIIFSIFHLYVLVPGSSISFSSYPGKLQSEDDYYIVKSGLVSHMYT